MPPTARPVCSAKAVSRAGLTDLMEAPGISQAMAETIWNYFNERG